MDELRRFLSRFLELPEDLLLDLPRLTMIGNLQVLIENHRGLIAFRPEFVMVETSKGPLEVRGQDLHIGAVDREAIVVTGAIGSVQFRGGRDG